MMKFSKHFFKDLCNALSVAYLFILFAVYPFYMKEGYVGIDVAKYKFFLYTALGAIILLLLSGLSELIQSVIDRKFGMVNASICIFALVSGISYALSDYKEYALVGANGWFMGLATILVMCVLSYLISILYSHKECVWYAVLGGSFVVFLLGILDRFSLYLIPLEVRNNSFISTLGNINWFMGYYSVLAPIGIFFFLKKLSMYKDMKFAKISQADKIKLWLLLIYTVVAFVAGFVQGSESVILFFGALMVGVLVLWINECVSFDSFLCVVAIWGLSGQLVRILRALFAKYYNYETTGLLSAIQTGRGTLFIAIISIIGIYHYKKSQNPKKDKTIRIITLITIMVLVVAYFIIGILNTKGLLPKEIGYSVFLFDERFGSGRGKAYKVAFECLQTMSPKQIIFGVGPDSFSAFAYSINPIRDQLYTFWPTELLHNAHSELLTMLINEGIIGICSYISIFVCTFIAFVKKSKNPETMCIALAAFCYLVHNLISFSQVVNTPFMFALFGIGSSIYLSEGERKA